MKNVSNTQNLLWEGGWEYKNKSVDVKYATYLRLIAGKGEEQAGSSPAASFSLIGVVSGSGSGSGSRSGPRSGPGFFFKDRWGGGIPPPTHTPGGKSRWTHSVFPEDG